MKTPYDAFNKELLSEVLESLGQVLPGKEIVAEPVFADVVFIPSSVVDASERARCGVLGRLSMLGPCILEPYSNNPRLDDIQTGLRKLWSHVLKEHEYEGERPPQQRLWVVSSGRPGTLLKHFGCQPDGDWPRGFYRSVVEQWMWVIVVSELPKRHDTLLLRLMGRRKTLLQALEELKALPDDSFEKRRVWPIVLRWVRQMGDTQHLKLAPFDKEALVRAQQWLEEHNTQEQQKGEVTIARRVLVRILEARGFTLSEEHREHILECRDVTVLERWIEHAARAETSEDLALLWRTET